MTFKSATGAAVLWAVLAAGACAQSPAPAHWVGTWTAAAQPAPATTPAIDNQTVRMFVRVSLGGTALRLRFSNAFGTQPVELADVHVALAPPAPYTDRSVTFAGQPSITMPPGADVVSDPLPMAVPPLARLMVSIYVPAASGPVTWHALADATSFITGNGDFTARPQLPSNAVAMTRWYWLAGVDVVTPPSAFAIVTLGDSITDGAHASLDADHRWPDILAGRLPGVGVLNEGISGNRILHDEAGPNALARFDRDVLAPPGARALVILEGINDIGWPDEKSGHYANQAVSADQIIAGLKQLTDRAHAHGLRVYGATLTPYGGAAYEAAAGEAKRQAINAWIRTSGAFDAVIDFDQVTRDPKAPTQFLPAYDSGDHLHPNDAGYQAMGEAAARVLSQSLPHVR